jgi:tripartite-type tricarboxylate transporter receptor subunit TctC
MMRRRSNAALVVLLALVGLTIPARAQYPDPAKRITIVVPFSAGGSNDILSRTIGQKLSDAWNLPVIIDNQVGASGSLGASRVARSAPDGYTLLILSSNLHDQLCSGGEPAVRPEDKLRSGRDARQSPDDAVGV